MKPYYQHQGITIYHGDCLEVLPLIESIDFVFTDLPYGTTSCSWDFVIPMDKLWIQYNRINKGIVALTASQPFTSYLVTSNPEKFKYEWIWKKNKGSNFLNTKHQPMKEHESILIFGQGSFYPQRQKRDDISERWKHLSKPTNHRDREQYGGFESKITLDSPEDRVPSSVQKFITETGLHPTQKPISLCKYFINSYTQPQQIVLDNCMGSGSTLVAAKDLNRQAIGIEIEERYCEIAAKRLSQEVFDFLPPSDNEKGKND